MMITGVIKIHFKSWALFKTAPFVHLQRICATNMIQKDLFLGPNINWRNVAPSCIWDVMKKWTVVPQYLILRAESI